MSEYFGDDRVFRDIEDIGTGAKFGAAIEKTLDSADGVVVLIGPGWLNAKDRNGGRRLDNPDDWVAKEIAAACQQGVSVFPVLIEDTPMPRPEELPEALQPLTAFNAISISDKRWRHDVTRLAKVISFDLPGSAIERKLNMINWLICIALLVSVTFTMAVVARNLWSSAKLAQSPSQPLSAPPVLSEPQAAASYVLIFPAAVLLLVYANQMDASRRIFATLAGLVGFLGAGASIIALNLFHSPGEDAIVLAVSSTIISTAMLGLMSLSGFRPMW